jgi:hypothetical protein
VIHIQGKFHGGVTGDKGVEQIIRYSDQKELDDNSTYIKWVITTADDFTEEARDKAEKNKVRLINGHEFARMLINAGVDNISDAF